jgi:hypothetical protein
MNYGGLSKGARLRALLSDLWVELLTLGQKTKHAALAINEFQDSLP